MFQVTIYEEITEWFDPEDSDGYETRTSEEVDDDEASLEDVIDYARRYYIEPRSKNDLTSWWESESDSEFDFSINASRRYSMHLKRDGKQLDQRTFDRINRLIAKQHPFRPGRGINPTTDLRDVAWPSGLELGGVEVYDKLNDKMVIYWRADGSGLVELEKALQKYGARHERYVVQGVSNDGRVLVDNQGGSGGEIRWLGKAQLPKISQLKNKLLR